MAEYIFDRPSSGRVLVGFPRGWVRFPSQMATVEHRFIFQEGTTFDKVSLTIDAQHFDQNDLGLLIDYLEQVREQLGEQVPRTCTYVEGGDL